MTLVRTGRGGSLFRQLALKVALLWGWRRLLVASLAGAAASLAQPPFAALPVLLLSLPILVWLIDGTGVTRRPRQSRPALRQILSAGVIGWAFGFGYFISGLYWIGHAFLVEAELFAHLMPFALVGLTGVLALVWGCASALAATFWFSGAARILVLAASFGIFEWLRGVLFSGFPWNPFAQALLVSDALAQSFALFGVYGLNMIVIAIAAAPATLADSTGAGFSRWRATAVAGLALLLLAGGGGLRLYLAEPGFVEDVRLRIVQANIDQRDKWRKEKRDEIVERYMSLSDRATSPETSGIGDVTHLIWPEAALPVLLAREPEILDAIGGLLPEGRVLITGSTRMEPDETGARRFFNSLFVVDDDGRIVQAYDKVHLVPFGEYLPFQPVLEAIGLRQLTKLRGGFEAGPVRRALPVPGAPPAIPLICYEIIFSGAAVPDEARAGWILNLTNDAWFGTSIGPHQHLAQARMRAIEEGLPVVRAAVTGISAVIGPYGSLNSSIPLLSDGVIDARLPVPTAQTPYSLVGFWAWVLTLCVFIVLAYVLSSKDERKPRESLY